MSRVKRPKPLSIWAIWSITVLFLLLATVSVWAKPVPGPLRWTIPTFTPTPTPHTGTISVLVYHDRNGDGIRQPPSEELLAGAELRLTNIGGSAILTDTTVAGEPSYFRSLATGTYIIREKDPPGYRSTTENTWGAIVLANITVTVPFGDVLQSTPWLTALPLILRLERSE